jgi:choice-of-anchor A domain-containing protein
MDRIPKVVFGALFLVAGTIPAAASSSFGPFSGTGWDASAFNIVTLGLSSDKSTGNFNPSSDVGGRVAVFGSYNGNGYQINSQETGVPDPYTENYALIVNGDVTTNPFLIGTGGNENVWVGGSNPANVFTGGHTTVFTSPASLDFDFVSARTSLQTLSSTTLTTYAGATTATITDNGTNLVITTPVSGTMFVYDVDYTYFTNQNRAFEVDLKSGQSVIINITGAPSSFTFAKGTLIKIDGNAVFANTTGGVPVLFNIPESTAIATSNGAINGSILAPYATFASPNQTIDGQLFVAAVNGLAETHDQYYSGVLPTSTPEPASLLLFGAAVACFRLRPRAARRHL